MISRILQNIIIDLVFMPKNTGVRTLVNINHEMKYLIPKKCWEIINKGVPKKSLRERGGNQSST